MFAAISPSDSAGLEADATTHPGAALQRSRGVVRIGFKVAEGRTRLADLYQEGSGKVRLPKPVAEAAEAVVLNTSGGLTGGDRFAVSIALGEGARAEVSGQAFEKIYRSSGGEAEMVTALDVAAGARLDWLPQPAILFDRSALRRRTDVTLAADAAFLAVEGLVFGRAAMGERMERGSVHDAWRIRRDGRLVFADAFSIDAGESGSSVADMLAGAAMLGETVATTTILYSAGDARNALEPVREILAGMAVPAGASLVGDLLVIRIAAPSAEALVGDAIRVLSFLRGRPMPRVWHC